MRCRYKTDFKISSNCRTEREFIGCQIIAVPGQYDFKPFGIGYQKDSPYAEIFDYYLDQMRQTGLIDQIRSKYFGFSQACPDIR